MGLQTKQPKKLAVLFIILAASSWIYLIVECFGGLNTGAKIGDASSHAIVALSLTYVSIMTWRKFTKASKQEIEKEKLEG